MEEKRRAVFFDRDGTINEEVGYLSRLEDLKIFDDAAESVRKIKDRGFLAIIITNQSGVARGFFDEQFVLTVHEKINEYLEREGTRFDALYYCPHHPKYGNEKYRKACPCRKPEPGLLLRAADDFNIDLKKSYVVGDMPRDMDIARKVGAKAVMVRTGYGKYVTVTDKADFIAADLREAADWIIRDQK